MGAASDLMDLIDRLALMIEAIPPPVAATEDDGMAWPGAMGGAFAVERFQQIAPPETRQAAAKVIDAVRHRGWAINLAPLEALAAGEIRHDGAWFAVRTLVRSIRGWAEAEKKRVARTEIQVHEIVFRKIPKPPRPPEPDGRYAMRLARLVEMGDDKNRSGRTWAWVASELNREFPPGDGLARMTGENAKQAYRREKKKDRDRP